MSEFSVNKVVERVIGWT